MRVKIIEQGHKSLNMFLDEINDFLSQDDLVVVNVRVLDSGGVRVLDGSNLKCVIIYKKGNM